MRLVSTIHSSHRGEVSVLAIAETVLAVGASAWVAVRYETLAHVAASAVLASMLLFRTRRSDRLAIKYLRKAHRQLIGRGIDNVTDLTIVSRNVSLLLILISLASRAVALIRSFFAAPSHHFVATRKNWRRLALATDSLTVVELAPGVELLPEENGDSCQEDIKISNAVKLIFYIIIYIIFHI